MKKEEHVHRKRVEEHRLNKKRADEHREITVAELTRGVFHYKRTGIDCAKLNNGGETR